MFHQVWEYFLAERSGSVQFQWEDQLSMSVHPIGRGFGRQR